ncbi:hypothetical protein BDZ91DRAFT_762985 [Kalaharituber pfeilii]|nr:hypothetical protein BDZ91DRAFT_762985 [Kalaharituber pfeilii]
MLGEREREGGEGARTELGRGGEPYQVRRRERWREEGGVQLLVPTGTGRARPLREARRALRRASPVVAARLARAKDDSTGSWQAGGTFVPGRGGGGRDNACLAGLAGLAGLAAEPHRLLAHRSLATLHARRCPGRHVGPALLSGGKNKKKGKRRSP